MYGYRARLFPQVKEPLPPLPYTINPKTPGGTVEHTFRKVRVRTSMSTEQRRRPPFARDLALCLVIGLPTLTEDLPQASGGPL